MNTLLSKHLLLIICITYGTISLTFAQEHEYGKISRELLLQTAYEQDSSAPAAVIYRDHSVRFVYRPNDGFHVVTYVHEVIKIYKKEGFPYATISQKLYKNNGESESLGNLKGITYNLEGGEVVETRLKSKDSFKKSLNKYYDQEDFTMPNLQEGSVIEYQYRMDSPFSYSIDDIKLQYDIPIQYQQVKIAVPEYYYFKPLMKGYLKVEPAYGKATDKIELVSRQNDNSWFQNNGNLRQRTLTYAVNTTQYTMSDVPALKEEPYVNDMDNYRAAVLYELQFVQFPQSERKDYASNWEKVSKTITESDDFGQQLSYSKYFREIVEGLGPEAGSDKERLARVFNHVQQHMHWDGYRGYATDKGVRKAYDEKSGNAAEINLLLIGLLREAGFKANPVLVSTRDHGVPLFPTLEGFNYVVAQVALDGKTVLLDATNKYTRPGIVPKRALNWQGMLLEEGGGISSVPLNPKKPSEEICMLGINILPNGDVVGKERRTLKDYKALEFRESNGKQGEDEYLQRLEGNYGGMEVQNYSVQNKEENNKPVVENFEFALQKSVLMAGNRILLSPLFHHTLTENPFKLEKREYPIDFAYPFEQKYMVNITIPEGYRVSSLPENTLLKMEKDMGHFKYQIQALDSRKVQLLVELTINEAVIPAIYYPMIKEIYRKIIEKESEKVVLSKIQTDEHTGRATGGR